MLTRPARLLRIEEACLLSAAILVYSHFRFSWGLFAVLFLAPDLFMLGYLINARIGSALYNLAHTLSLPVMLFAIAWYEKKQLPLAIAIIWISHICFDRLLGYGLKYPSQFKDTYLQRIG